MTLLCSFAMSPAMNKHCFINLPDFCILFSSFLQILWCVLTINTKFHTCTWKFLIDFLKECSDLTKETVSGFSVAFSIPRSIYSHLLQTWSHQCIDVEDPHALSWRFFVYILKYFFNGISKYFVDEVAESAVRRCLMIHKIHEAEIDFTLILQFTQWYIAIRHKSEQNCFQHADRVISESSCIMLRNIFRYFSSSISPINLSKVSTGSQMSR